MPSDELGNEKDRRRVVEVVKIGEDLSYWEIEENSFFLHSDEIEDEEEVEKDPDEWEKPLESHYEPCPSCGEKGQHEIDVNGHFEFPVCDECGGSGEKEYIPIIVGVTASSVGFFNGNPCITSYGRGILRSDTLADWQRQTISEMFYLLNEFFYDNWVDRNGDRMCEGVTPQRKRKWNGNEAKERRDSVSAIADEIKQYIRRKYHWDATEFEKGKVISALNKLKKEVRSTHVKFRDP